MQRDAVRRVGAGFRMAPAVARIGVRRLRRRVRRDGGTRRAASTVWRSETSRGVVTWDAGTWHVALDGIAIGRLTCRVDLGTSTAECESSVAGDVMIDVVELLVSSVRDDVRRVAWFVASGDTALENALSAAGFVIEGWAAPPLTDSRPHQQWALITGTP